MSCLASWCTGQSDSLLLEPKELGIDDIVSSKELYADDVKIISGNRFPIAAADLPFSTHVITAEEIRMNGYETLVDALKMAPGIRVSQPGSAIEGETFLMRGLLGNTYTQILIDDVPIKPSFLAAMPIGAQLPIKEAERIEIIYGSGAALYGADASAGVINIVSKKSEKPVFMQADLSVGGGQYSAVNVMFGGRLGRGKKVLRYFAYASNVLFEQRPIFYDQNYNYNPLNYPQLTGGDTSFFFRDNYAGTTPDQPLLTNTPHLSRRVGGYLKFRRMTLSVENMYRRDHSSIGMNPVAVSYRNPLTYTGERIFRVNLNFFKNKPKHNRKTDITWIQYNMDERSSILFVQDQVANELSNAALATAKSLNPDSVGFYRNVYFNQSYDRYLNGDRYRYGLSGELRIEHVQNYRLFKRITLTAGLNGKAAGGYPMTEFLSRPTTEDGDYISPAGFAPEFDATTFPIFPDLRDLVQANAFTQLFYNGKRFNLTGGINQTWYGTFDDADGTVNTISRTSERISGLLKISEGVNIRTSWGRSFRIPNEWYGANSYNINSEGNNSLRRTNFEIDPEVTSSWESGIRFKRGDKVGSEFTWFSNETSNLIGFRRGSFFNGDSTVYNSFLGYLNNDGSKVRYRGGQILLTFNVSNNDKTPFQGHYAYGWTKASLTLPDGENIDLPQGEGRIHQLRGIIRPGADWTLILDYIRVRGLGRRAGPDPEDKYNTLDLMVRYAFTNRFDGYIKVINLFNENYSGIPATRTANDLIYNPQNGFFLRLGMNYYIE